jgi:predicted nucleic acid-binding protein
VRTVADTAPLLAATNRRDRAHELATGAVAGLGRELVVLDTVMAEVDYLLRTRVGVAAARAFLSSLVAGELSTAFLSPGLLRRATEIDARYAALDLGLVDASVMAYAERHDLPVLTFDFEDFRAAPPPSGHWRLIVDEARYADATS